MKKITTVALTFGMIISFAGASFAMEPLNSATSTRPLKTTASSNSAMLKTTNTEAKSATLNTRAANEISRRITALKELLTKIAGLKHLTDTEKSTLSSGVQAEIDSLTALQAKIQADTDLATLKADVQSIVTSYRVFALYIPQVRLLTAAESLDNVADNMLGIGTRLQTRLTELQNAGENVTSAQTTLSNMQFKLTDAKAQSNAITAAVTPLTPAGFPGNKTTLQAARTRLATGVKDIKEAAIDAKQIMSVLKEMGSTKMGSSSANSTTDTANQIVR